MEVVCAWDGRAVEDIQGIAHALEESGSRRGRTGPSRSPDHDQRPDQELLPRHEPQETLAALGDRDPAVSPIIQNPHETKIPERVLRRPGERAGGRNANGGAANR